MYVLILFAIIMGPDGPIPITRPSVEYYKTEADCKKLGVRHIKEFMAAFDQEKAIFAAKCVEVKQIEGEPA